MKGQDSLALKANDFKDFLHTSSNFAKLAFAKTAAFHVLPHLIEQSKEMVVCVRQEMQRRFPEICSDFTTIVQSFVKLVTNTRHNMSIAKSHLNKAIALIQMRVVKTIESAEPLSADDTSDMRRGFLNMTYGVKKMLFEVSHRNWLGECLQEHIEDLVTYINFKIQPIDGRIEFSKLVLKIAAGLAGILLVGTLLLGGMSILPINTAVTTTVVSGLAVDAVGSLIIIIWQKDLHKLQSKLKLVLDYLDKISKANMSFNGNMFKSKESICFLLSYLDYLGQSLEADIDQRRRSICAERCLHAIGLAQCLIGRIDLLEHIDLK